MSQLARGYETAAREAINDDSDQEEETMVEDYKEQAGAFNDGMDELDPTMSYGIGAGGGGPQDMQAQLAAAATPLEYQATLETKFASYDNYCNLFHYILNSEGPVDLEVPTVRRYPFQLLQANDHMEDKTDHVYEVLLGLGRHRRIHIPVRVFLPVPQPPCTHRPYERRVPTTPGESTHLGLLLCP